MQLKALTALRKQTETLHESRHAAGDERLFEGLACLELAHSEGYQRPETLKTACSLLIEAMKSNRADARPCLGLAYLFMIIEAHDTALDYIRLALEIEPGNIFAQALKESLQDQLTRHGQRARSAPATSQAAPVAVPAVPRALDLDDLYDQTEQLILDGLRKQLSQPRPRLAYTLPELKRLQGVESEFKTFYQDIEARLEQIDREIDISDLKVRFRPFEQLAREYQRLVGDSKTVLSLMRQLDSLRQETTQEINALARQGMPENADASLNRLLDQGDRIADALDELETRGHEITALMEPYNQVLALLEKYQDLCDEGD